MCLLDFEATKCGDKMLIIRLLHAKAAVCHSVIKLRVSLWLCRSI